MLVGVVLALAATWIVFVLVLVIFRTRGISLSEATRLVPDMIRLLRAIASDSTLPNGVRRRLGLLLAYLALPFDLVPDFIPLLGHADDVIVVAIVIRSVVRRAGADALERHWTGTPHGLSLVRSLSGIAVP